MGRGESSADGLLYGDVDLTTPRGPDGFEDLPELDLELKPKGLKDFEEAIGEVQQVVDRITTWEKIDSSWFRDLRDPDKHGGNIPPNAYSNENEKRWRDDTRKRWKVGVVHHQRLGLLWSAWRDVHQVTGEPHSGRDEQTLTAETLGELLSEVYSFTAMMLISDKERQALKVPHALRDWWDSRSEEESTASLNKRYHDREDI